MLRLSDKFDREKFLREYWQQKPVLLSGLFDSFADPISPEELAGLACEAEIESRLIEGAVTRDSTSGRIQAELSLRHGPIPEDYFPTLPDKNWTVLVQAVDQWLGEVADLRLCFDFLPNWRLEDVMISFAAPGGTVGPHFDHYDVFLIQGSGSRCWQIGERCDANTEVMEQAGLSLLPHFECVESFELRAGDALYVPPRFAHWGSATEAGLCYSVGLRSPSLGEMLEGYSDALIKCSDPADRYTDPAPAQESSPSSFHPAEIKSAMLDEAYNKVMATLGQRSAFNRWFGCQVTQPRYPEHILAPESDYDFPAINSALQAGAALLRHPGSRFAMMHDQDELLLFVDGACITLPMLCVNAVESLCDLQLSDCSMILSGQDSPEVRNLILQLVNQGSLVIELPTRD